MISRDGRLRGKTSDALLPLNCDQVMPTNKLIEPSPAEAGTRATQSSLVYECLRSDILHGVLEPDRRLQTEAMCKRYGVSASPLREALSRLFAEGLVSRHDQRGFSVAPLRWNELQILIRTRLQIESLALRESIENRSREWEEQLALILHRLSRTPRSLSSEGFHSNPAWESLHSAFHRSLLACCPSRWLRAYSEDLSESFYRFRIVAAGQSYGRRDPHAEHTAIFQMAIDGRADEAVALLAEHYHHTSTLVTQLAEQLNGAMGNERAALESAAAVEP